jgi:heme a synthase
MSGRPTAAGESFDAWRHRATVVCAAATVVLLMAGGLVTSTGSGLAVPDWPLSFGGFFPRMEGGVLYEHGHRLIAAFVGLFTLGLMVWYQVRERRGWVRGLSVLALAVVVAQAVLGGLTVILKLPIAVSVAHACLAQAFFCLMVVMALATSRGFVSKDPLPLAHEGSPPLWRLTAVCTLLVYLQLVLGAVVRHSGAGLAIPDFPLAFGSLLPPLGTFEVAIHFAHRVGALVVAGAVAWAGWRILRRHAGRKDLAQPARWALLILAGQIVLGGTSVLTRLAVLPTTLHVVFGAMLLAACLVITVRAARGRTLHGRTEPLGALAGERA